MSPAGGIDDGNAPAQHWRARLRSEGAQVGGTVDFHDQSTALTAEFAPAGWWPRSGNIRAGDGTIPAAAVGLGEHYLHLLARGQAEWKDARFTADLAVECVPRPDHPFGRLQAVARASGDASAISLDAIDVTWPGLEAHLSESIRIGRDGVVSPATARFTVQADLTAEPWGFERGRLSGEARLVGEFSPRPEFFFRDRQ